MKVITMHRNWIIIGFLLLAGADKPVSVLSPPPPSTPSNIVNHSPSVWDRIQDPLDRSTGRIIDQPSYEVGRIQRDRIAPENEFRRFQEERERALRIAQLSAQQQADVKRAQDLQTPINNDGLIGLTPAAAQAMNDELALSKVRSERDRQLIAANQQRTADLKQRPTEQSQIEAEYQKKIDAIEQQFQSQRAAILGYGPATQPEK